MASFTFVTSSGPPDSKSKTTTPTTKDVVRSHAMQQVWEQRRSQQARKREGNHFEIVVENDSVGSSKAKFPGRRKSLSQGKSGTGKRPVSLPPKANLRRTASAPDHNHPSSTSESKILALFPPKSNQRNKSQGQDFLIHAADEDGTCHELSEADSELLLRAATRLDKNSYVGMNTLDPFSTCALNIGPVESRYLKHYFTSLSWRFTMPKKTWLCYAIENPGMLHGVLTVAAAHQSYSSTKSLSLDALRYQGKTIENVRRCIEDPKLQFSDMVIGAIGRLAICNLFFGIREHFISHMQGLEWMAKGRGGIDNLGLNGQLKFIIASLVAGAGPTWWKFVPPSLRHPYGPLDYPAVQDIPLTQPMHPAEGAAFRALNQAGFLSDELLDIVQALINLNTFIECKRLCSEAEQRVFGHISNKLQLRLVYIKDRQQRDLQGQHDHMLESTRLGLQLYLSIFQREAPINSNLGTVLLRTLGHALDQTNLQNSWGGGLQGKLLLWILVMITACSSGEERKYFGVQLQKTAAALSVTDFKHVQRIGQSFIWLNFMIEPVARPVWKQHVLYNQLFEANDRG